MGHASKKVHSRQRKNTAWHDQGQMSRAPGRFWRLKKAIYLRVAQSWIGRRKWRWVWEQCKHWLLRSVGRGRRGRKGKLKLNYTDPQKQYLHSCLDSLQHMRFTTHRSRSTWCLKTCRGCPATQAGRQRALVRRLTCNQNLALPFLSSIILD